MDEAVTPFRTFIGQVPGMEPGAAQELARRQFPGRVAESALCWRVPGQPLPQVDEFLLIGVAVWSGYDLNMLDHLNTAVAGGVRPHVLAYVFDADSCNSPDEFEAIFPGIGFVHHTPVVGHWRGGTLVEKACGFHGRQLVAWVYGIDEQLIPAPADSLP